jgi:hypothetical protein
MRQKLRVEAVSEDAADRLCEELCSSIPLAALFLKHLQTIEVRRNNQPERVFKREPDTQNECLIVSDGDSPSLWYLLRTDFQDVASQLRQKHPDLIEAKRSAMVTIAIPEEPMDTGLFCAFLPTQHRTGLPFHINADFFPTSSRKEIVLESDYQSEWNRAAITAAAKALADGLEKVRDSVGHIQLWQIIQSVSQMGQDANVGRCDVALGDFWRHLTNTIKSADIIYTSAGSWTSASQVFYLEQKDESRAATVLECLGCRLVHEELRFAQNLLLSKTIDVPVLGARDVAKAIKASGLTQRMDRESLPVCLRRDSDLTVLWDELSLLMGQYDAGRRRAREDRHLAVTELV